MPASVVLGCIIATRLSWNTVMNVPPDMSRIVTLALVIRLGMYMGCGMVGVPVVLWGTAVLLSGLSVVGIGAPPTDHFWLDIHAERVPEIDSSLLESRHLMLRDSGFLDNLIAALPFISGPIVHSRLYVDDRTPGVISDWYQEVSQVRAHDDERKM
jgi:hypothetical protein